MKLRNMLSGSAWGHDDFTPPGVCSVDPMLDFDGGGGGDTGSQDGGDGKQDKTDQAVARRPEG